MREKERDRGGREKDKKRFRVGERKIGRETGVVERERKKIRETGAGEKEKEKAAESEPQIERKRDRDGREKEERETIVGDK